MRGLCFRIVTGSGRVLVDEPIDRVEDVEATATRHRLLADAALLAGETVHLVVTDPDGILPDFHWVEWP